MNDPKVYCSHTEMVLTDIIKGNPKNPNKHPDRQIELLGKIIKNQGWRAPITISKRSGLVVKGHGRLEAAKLIGCEKVPVDYQEYESEAAEIADLLADNKIQELSEIDTEIELFHKQELIEADFDLEVAGFDLEYKHNNDYESYNMNMIDGKDNLDGQNYTNVQSSRYSINLFGIGGFIPREKGDVIKNMLEDRGANAGEDNSEIIERFMDEILSI